MIQYQQVINEIIGIFTNSVQLNHTFIDCFAFDMRLFLINNQIPLEIQFHIYLLLNSVHMDLFNLLLPIF